MKPEIIKDFEALNGRYSIVNLSLDINDFSKFDNNKNLTLEFSESDFVNSKIDYRNKLYKTASSFFIYVEKQFLPPFEKLNERYSFKLTIYYKPTQINEITIFLLQLLKK